MNRNLIRNRNYILLFSAQIISLLGSCVTTVGLAIFACQLTGGASVAAVIGNTLFLRILGRTPQSNVGDYPLFLSGDWLTATREKAGKNSLCGSSAQVLFF
jgi:hypothetical protein